MSYSSSPRCFALMLFSALSFAFPGPAQPAEAVDATTLTGKLIMGYQGWFGCPDPSTHSGWSHWKSGDQFTVDMLPDTTELSPAEKCDSGLKAADGTPVYLFDSINPQTVDRHFSWMEQYGLPGIAFQRFASQLMHPGTHDRSNKLLRNIRESAERHGRVFFVMYDLSGMSDDKLQVVADDWEALNSSRQLQSPSYLQHRAHPLLGLWGLGFAHRRLTPNGVKHFIEKMRMVGSAWGGISIMGGVPAGWRTGSGDASEDPAWKEVWPMLDVVSPWTVGRYNDEKSINAYLQKFLLPDRAAASAIGSDYMPVIFPGFSWSNLMHARRDYQRAIPNQIPRKCGHFYWLQSANAVNAGATMLYNAMFDEVDEGTAMFKTLPTGSKSPKTPEFIALDADHCNLPSDWFLRLAGSVNLGLQKGHLPLLKPSPRN